MAKKKEKTEKGYPKEFDVQWDMPFKKAEKFVDKAKKQGLGYTSGGLFTVNNSKQEQWLSKQCKSQKMTMARTSEEDE